MNTLRCWFVLALGLLLSSATLAATPDKQSDSFDSGGVKIAYVQAGKGDDVILIHGLYSSAQTNWELPGTFDLLAQHYHVIALDLRGHGQSDKPQDDASYGQPMVDDITRLMDHLKIKQAHIVGYSLGGIIVMKFAVDHPDRVTSMTLGGMGWLKSGSVLAESFTKLGGREFAGKTPDACVHSIAKLGVDETQVKSINVPVTMLVGDHDPCRRLYVEPAAKLRPDWKVVILPDAGHITAVGKQEFKDGVLQSLAAAK